MRIILAFVLLVFGKLSAQQPILAAVVDHEHFSAEKFIGHDQYGFTYYIANNTIVKSRENVTIEYKKVALGRIASVDIINPLMVVVFYEDFNAVVLLDNQLNEIRQIKFSDLPQPIIAGAVGLASQNRLWIYDMATQQIGLLGMTEGRLQAPVSYPNGKFRHYQSDLLNFRWINERNELQARDLFGKTFSLGTMPEADRYQILNNALLFSKDGKIYYQSAESAEPMPIEIGEKTFRGFHFNHQILSIFTDKGLTNYKIILP